MKRFLVLLLTSTLVLGACGNSGNDKNESKTESVNENKAQFKNDTLVIDDAVVSIKDTFIVNDKNSDSKLLAFKYEVKNKTDKDEITPMNVWISSMTATQDSENTVNDLEVGPTPNTGKFEEWDKHSQDKIKKDKTAKGITTYTLENDEDITLKATKGVDGKELGTKKIKLDDLKTVDYDATEDLTSDNTSDSETDDSNNDEQTASNDDKSEQPNNSNNENKSNDNETVIASSNTNATQKESTQSSNNSNEQSSNEEIPTTTHDESQIGYGKGDYEAAKTDSEKAMKDPNAHVGGPGWVNEGEGYDSWKDRQQEVQESQQ